MLSFWAGGISSFFPCAREYRLLRRLPLKERFRIKKAMFAYNVRNNDKLPQSMINKFKTKDNSNYNLRNYTDFVLKKPKTNFMKKSISYSAASLWNKLPKSAKTKGIGVAEFKSILDRR